MKPQVPQGGQGHQNSFWKILETLAKSSKLEGDHRSIIQHCHLTSQSQQSAVGANHSCSQCSHHKSQLFAVQPSLKFQVFEKFPVICFGAAKIHILISKNNDYKAECKIERIANNRGPEKTTVYVTDTMFDIIYCFVAISKRLLSFLNWTLLVDYVYQLRRYVL